jgi:hypothetical protein
MHTHLALPKPTHAPFAPYYCVPCACIGGLDMGGQAICWGLASDESSDQPTLPTGVTFTSLDSFDWHTCGLDTKGRAHCFGRDDHGQSTPPAEAFVAVSAGSLHSCKPCVEPQIRSGHSIRARTILILNQSPLPFESRSCSSEQAD